MPLRIIRIACLLCLLAPPCVVVSMTGAQAQTASSTQSASKATKKKPAKKIVHDAGRGQPATPNATSGASYGGVFPRHDARQGY